MSIHCSVTDGDLPIRLEWMYNDQPLRNGNGVEIFNHGLTSLMIINQVRGEQSGSYTCIATNKATSVNSTVQLIVKGKVAVL